jgi:DNA-binding HxlR family transcriptional regulator
MKFYETRHFERLLSMVLLGEMHTSVFIERMSELETFFNLLKNDYDKCTSLTKVSLNDYLDELETDMFLDRQSNC